MTASQMTASQMHRFIRFCEDQGIKVLRTKKGLMIRFPDGSATVQHFTTSDVRALPNQISAFRRAGMVHPQDTRAQKELPSYITGGTISHKTKQRILDLVEQLGYPDTVYSSTVVKETTMDPTSANRALYHSGFRPGPAKTKRVGRPWYTPDDILELKDKPRAKKVTELDSPLNEVPETATEEHEEAIETEGPLEVPVDTMVEPDVPRETGTAEEAEALYNALPDYSPEPVTMPAEPTPEHVYFLDERDSWSVDMEDVLGEHLYRMVRDRLSVLTAVGLEYEVRVWRKK